MEHFQRQSAIPGLVVKLGANGAIVSAEGRTVHYPPMPTPNIVSVTGAGDSLAAGTIYSLLTQQSSAKKDISRSSLHEAIKFGLAAAHLSLQSSDAVSPLLSGTLIQQIVSEHYK